MENSWIYNYKRGIESVERGELKQAYDCGVECMKIVKKLYSNAIAEEQVGSLEKYLKSLFLLKSCSEAKNCLDCIEKQYLGGINSLAIIHRSTTCHHKVRIKAWELILLLKNELIGFYQKNEMKYELAVFESHFKTNNKQLILVEGSKL